MSFSSVLESWYIWFTISVEYSSAYVYSSVEYSSAYVYSNCLVSNLDLAKLQSNPKSIPCRCTNFDKKFCDPNHKHIVTGDLSIISNSLLRNLISKGPNFREPMKVDFDVARDTILDSLSTFIETLSELKKKPGLSFVPWRDKIMEIVDNKIHFTRLKFPLNQFQF